MNRIFMTLFLVSMIATDAAAYEQETHRDLSKQAFLRSNIVTDSSLLTDLGLQPYSSNQEFPDPYNPGETATIETLLMNGADFEDNEGKVVNHFYDPVYDRPLFLGHRSPDWALEDNGNIDSDPSVQEYSYKDAMDYYYKALTSATEAERDMYWGKTFQTLGNVIHHIQDMSQPEHVRNDAHLVGVDSSYYESYTLKRNQRAQQGFDPVFKNLLESSNYPIPAFSTAREFWTTRTSSDSPTSTAGFGASDFTNINFVSKDTNFMLDNGSLAPNSIYKLPLPGPVTSTTLTSLLGDGGAACAELVASGPTDLPTGSDCIVDFIQSTVTDNLNLAEGGTNPRASSLSLFDAYFDKYDVPSTTIEPEEAMLIDVDRVPTLNKYNFDEAHNFLIPRAISYSAGIINHFFSERITVNIDLVNGNFDIKNVSGDTMYGEFYLYGELIDKTDNLQQIQSWPISASGLTDSTELPVDIPDLSSYKTELKLVYRGTTGNTALMDTVDVTSVENRYIVGGYNSYDQDINPLLLEKFNTKTFYHHSYNTYTFNSSITIESGSSGFVNDYYWRFAINTSYECIVEMPGYRDLDDVPNLYIFSMSLINNMSSLGPGTPLVDTVNPSEVDCDTASYGYRTTAWNDGWISKFPRTSSLTLDFEISAFSDSDSASVEIDSNFNQYDVATESCVFINKIFEVNTSWNNTAFGNNTRHNYDTYAEYIADNPTSYLDTYIPNELNDYRCK